MAAKRALKRKFEEHEGVADDEFFSASENLRYDEKTTFSKGGYGSAFHRGYWKENDSKEKQVYVKVTEEVDCLDNWKSIVDKHKDGSYINDDNVLKILGFEEKINGDCRYRYFVFEWFDATLEQYCNKVYKGPMPTDVQVLCQIANGIDHLHANDVSHGNLNPQTILISQSQPVRVKISDCGLSRYFGDEPDGLSHPQYWRRGTNEATVNGDIFAAGCLLFYFLTRGWHPFGEDLKSILENISKGNPVRLEELNEKHALVSEQIKKLIGEPPKDGTQPLRLAAQEFKRLLPLKIDESKEYGKGAFGKVVGGTYEGEDVAVKKVHLSQIESKTDLEREMEEQMKLDHENVLKLLHVDSERNKTWRYLVLELCAGTLKDVCDKNYQGPPLPPDELVLYQIAIGLDYIHSNNLVHRDIKPGNILISRTTPIQIKVSDFGYCKKVSPQGTFTQSGTKGTLNWMAPEMLENFDVLPNDLPRGTIESDTFAAGCVFFFFLTRGSHPFGTPTFLNICTGNPVTLNAKIEELKKSGEQRQSLYNLAREMMKKKEERISLTEVIKQLTALITTNRQFKAIQRSFPLISDGCLIRFHPTEPVLACGWIDPSSMMILKAANGSIPFSNWRIEQEFKKQTQSGIYVLEWNANGTQLAAGGMDGTVIVWSYPSGRVIFEEKKHSKGVYLMAWNPFRQEVFATRQMNGRELLFWNSLRENGDAEKPNHFLTMKRQVPIWRVAWISANQIAIGLDNGEIEICQIDEDEGIGRVVKRFKHSERVITGLQWNERTKYLASFSVDKWMKIWSMDSDQPVHTLEVHSNCVCLTWRRNMKTDDDERKDKENFIIACGLEDGSIVVWNPLEEDVTKRKRILPQKHLNGVRSLSFSPDGRFLSSVGFRGELVIWSTETWLPIFTCQNAVGFGLSWMSMDSSSVPPNKLAVTSFDKVLVVEQSFSE